MAKQQLHLSKPCIENWSKMTPNQQGRHCEQCNLTVVDFTQHSKEEIIEFFEQRKHQHICGRYQKKHIDQIAYKHQLAQLFKITPSVKNYALLPVKLVVACYLLFITSSCMGAHVAQPATYDVNGPSSSIKKVEYMPPHELDNSEING